MYGHANTKKARMTREADRKNRPIPSGFVKRPQMVLTGNRLENETVIYYNGENGAKVTWNVSDHVCGGLKSDEGRNEPKAYQSDSLTTIICLFAHMKLRLSYELM